MARVIATRAFHIKLGRGDEYKEACFDNGTINLGYHDVKHEDGKYHDKIKEHYIKNGRKSGAAHTHANQVHAFYTEPKDTIWITFADGLLHWCQAEEEVIMLIDNPDEEGPDGSRCRKTVERWKSIDINDKPLYISELSGSLTKIAGYRGTICEVKKAEFEYLIRKINGEESEEAKEAKNARDTTLKSICKLIKMLYWKDFELLVDLVFARGDLQRFSATGGVQKFFDIEMVSPITKERVFVQIKTQTNQGELINYIKKFREWQKMDTGSKFFYVYHIPDSIDTSIFQKDDLTDIHLVNNEKLAEMVLDAGLFNWLLKKAS